MSEIMSDSQSRKQRFGKLEKLEALRGLAAIYVMCVHLIPRRLELYGINLNFLLRFGPEAVILFFLLSGFVIHYSFCNSRDRSFGTYFIKRFTRIYVPLIIVFVLGFLLQSSHEGRFIGLDAKAVLGNLLMLQDWGWAKPNVIVEPILGIGALWSLSYEWWFYMLYFPIATSRLSPGVRDSVVLLIFVLASVVYLYWPTFIPRLLMYMSIWWAGVMLADRYMADDRSFLHSTWKVVLAISLIISIQILGRWDVISELDPLVFGQHPLIEIRHIGFGLFAMLVALVWQRFRWIGFHILIGPFMVFAPISYMIYIAHHHLVTDAQYLSFIDNWLIEIPAYLLILFLCSWLVERWLYPRIRNVCLNSLSQRG